MRVLIASGGSGGHIFPAVSLAKVLARSDTDIIFVASRRHLDRNILKDVPYKKVFLSANPMPYRLGFGLFLFFFKLIVDSIHGLYTLVRFRSDVVVGFGGYTAGTILFLACVMRMKTVIHEQNLVPGRTNRFLDKLVDKVCISFPETRKYFKNKNIIFTGNPLREESLTVHRPPAFKHLGLEENRMTILIMGGSQGAVSLNRLVSESISLLPREKKDSIQLIHITGSENRETIEEYYNKNKIHASVFGFIKNINEAYSACDMVISRSGAAAIFELAAFKKPMILIPYPSQKNNQRFNAEFFAKNGAAIYRDEENIKGTELRDIILDLLENPNKRKTLAENAVRLSTVDGAKRLKNEIIKTLNSKH